MRKAIGMRFIHRAGRATQAPVAPMPVLAIDGDAGFGEHVAHATRAVANVVQGVLIALLYRTRSSEIIGSRST